MKDLTPKQQAKVHAKVVKLLLATGFQSELDSAGVPFYWRKVRVGEHEKRICVTYKGFSQFSQKLDDGWMFQRAKLNERPAFGYSGSTLMGVNRSVEQVLDEVYHQFWTAGINHSSAYHQDRVAKAKAKLTGVLHEVLTSL